MKRKPAPTNSKAPKKRAARSQFWVIDTDMPGMSKGQFSAMGPYATQAAAESSILVDTKNLWEDSCSCLQSEKNRPWCKPLHIVEVRRTVIPQITAKVVLVDAANSELRAPLGVDNHKA